MKNNTNFISSLLFIVLSAISFNSSASQLVDENESLNSALELCHNIKLGDNLKASSIFIMLSLSSRYPHTKEDAERIILSRKVILSERNKLCKKLKDKP